MRLLKNWAEIEDYEYVCIRERIPAGTKPAEAFAEAERLAHEHANNDAAAGRSLWLRRRVAVLHQAAGDGTAEFVKVPEEINCSDMHTKYLVFKRWGLGAT
jgi:hypothetical protein